MWTKILPAATALLYMQGVIANDCPYTVSVLDVAGVQCVTAAPCSGTYYASGLSQGVGACPSGTSCALLPLTPIMGCAEAGRADLTYVNADGTLTKDGRTVTLSGDSSKNSDASTSSTTSSKSSATSSTSSKSSTGSKTGSNSDGSSSTKSSSSSSNAASGSGSATSSTDGNSTSSSSLDASVSASSSNSSKTNSWESESGSGSNVISPGSSSANQQAEFNPGSILSDGSDKSASDSNGGLGLGSIIGIVVGCLAVVAIAAGMRLLKKGKEAELATPENGGVADGAAVEGYGGGGGMTPKENVLLL